MLGTYPTATGMAGISLVTIFTYIANILKAEIHSQKCSDPIRCRCQKNSVMGIFSEPNQYRSSIGTVSDQYAYVCIRPV